MTNITLSVPPDIYRKMKKHPEITRKNLNGYTTVLNILEFPRALELGLTVLTPSLEDHLLSQ